MKNNCYVHVYINNIEVMKTLSCLPVLSEMVFYLSIHLYHFFIETDKTNRYGVIINGTANQHRALTLFEYLITKQKQVFDCQIFCKCFG